MTSRPHSWMARTAITALLWALTLWLFARTAAVADPPGVVLRPGDRAPAWKLLRPDGEAVSFPAAPGGRPAVVLFWATWCPYCKALMPHLQQIRQDYRDRDIRVYAVNIWEDGDPVAFVRAHGYDFELLLHGDAVAERYGVYGTPGLFVVDADGRIVMNRYLIDLGHLPIDEQTPRRERAALSAPAWADVVRAALDNTL